MPGPNVPVESQFGFQYFRHNFHIFVDNLVGFCCQYTIQRVYNNRSLTRYPVNRLSIGEGKRGGCGNGTGGGERLMELEPVHSAQIKMSISDSTIFAYKGQIMLVSI